MKSILIFRTGQIGDFVVSLPAMWNIRRGFPHANIVLLSDVHQRHELVTAPQLLDGAGLVDRFDRLLVGRDGRVSVLSSLTAWRRLMTSNQGRFDAVVDLSPSRPTGIGRLRLTFFRLAGRKYFGSKQLEFLPDPWTGLSEFEALRLDRVAREITGHASDLADPKAWSLTLGEKERREFEGVVGAWREGPIRIALCSGAKISAKRWPVERYLEVLQQLERRFPIEVVVFGGDADREAAALLVRSLKSAHNLCGRLSPRASAYGIAQCDLYLGNDTGPMHLAAAAGRPCVAIFSARDRPGKWWPFGDRHRILWTPVACGGCLLADCKQQELRCLLEVDVERVLAACAQVISNLPTKRARLSGSPVVVSDEAAANERNQAVSGFPRPNYRPGDDVAQVNFVGASRRVADAETAGLPSLREELGAIGLLRESYSLVAKNGTRGGVTDLGGVAVTSSELRSVVTESVRRHPEDFWLCHGLDAAALADVIAAARAQRIGIVLSSADGENLMATSRGSLALRRVGLVIVDSNFTKRRLVAAGLRPARVHVVHYGIAEPESVVPLHSREDSTVLYLGGIGEHDTGPGELVEAASLLQRQHAPAKIILAGEGARLAYWQQEAASRGLKGTVEFTGRLTPAEVDRLYARADLFARPSVNDSDGMAFARAMARGLPCVGSDGDATPEIVDREAGICVPHGNPTALAHAIADVLRSPELRHRLRAGARRRFGERFSMAQYHQRLLSCIVSWRAQGS